MVHNRVETEKAGEPRVPLLQMTGITKWFGSLCANDHIDFDLYKGEIHALLGENGAGKTTLMNILYGLYQQDEGAIKLNGKSILIRSSQDAIQHRMGMIHQHFMLVPNLSVIENVLVGLKTSRGPFLNLDHDSKQLAQLANSLGLDIDPKSLVRDLPVGVQQRVEIVKALFRGSDILILDEPTAMLSPLEIGDFFKTLQGLVRQGLSIIFISHKLDEVMEISNRVTVLRRGKRIGTFSTSDMNKKSLAEMMIGRDYSSDFERSDMPKGNIALEVNQLSVDGHSGRPVLRNITLNVKEAEILGIAGVDGNGQQELADALVGLIHTNRGSIRVNNLDLTNKPPRRFISAGVYSVPSDRQNVGLVMNFSVEENLILKSCDKEPFSRQGILNSKHIHANADEIINRYDIRVSDSKILARNVSGGNQQKLILAREIEERPSVLILVNPTHGLDVGATEYVRQSVLEQMEKGVAILLISNDLDDILCLSDRVAVMFRGEIMGTVPCEEEYFSTIGRMMCGERLDQIT